MISTPPDPFRAERELEAPADVQVVREATRRGIAFVSIVGYFILLAVIIIVGWLVLKRDTDDVVKVLTATAGILGGIVGAVVGFYFRQEG